MALNDAVSLASSAPPEGHPRLPDPLPRFRYVVAIDWSGAVGTRHRGIALALAEMTGGPPRLVPPPSPRGWARAEVLDWLLTAAPAGTLAGFDMGISLAFADCAAYFPGWSETPPDARSLWSLVETLCVHEADLGAATFADHAEASRHFRRHGKRCGDLLSPGAGRMRVTEAVQAATGARPTSNFNLVGASQVGKASLAGMRLLHRLPAQVPVWPIDPIAAPHPRLAIVEIWTTIAAMAAGRRPGASKIRDGAGLGRALATLGSPPADTQAMLSDHAADALVTAAWLRRAATDPALWSPPALTAALARTEGWTFGVT